MRTKFSNSFKIIALILVFLMFIFNFASAIDSEGEGYRLNSGESGRNIYAAGGQCFIASNSGANDYFIPTKTQQEWDAFKAKAGSFGINISDCPVECKQSDTNCGQPGDCKDCTSEENREYFCKGDQKLYRTKLCHLNSCHWFSEISQIEVIGGSGGAGAVGTGCTRNQDCAFFCETSKGECVQCLSDSNCASGNCVDNECVEFGSCGSCPVASKLCRGMTIDNRDGCGNPCLGGVTITGTKECPCYSSCPNSGDYDCGVRVDLASLRYCGTSCSGYITGTRCDSGTCHEFGALQKKCGTPPAYADLCQDGCLSAIEVECGDVVYEHTVCYGTLRETYCPRVIGIKNCLTCEPLIGCPDANEMSQHCKGIFISNIDGCGNFCSGGATIEGTKDCTPASGATVECEDVYQVCIGDQAQCSDGTTKPGRKNCGGTGVTCSPDPSTVSCGTNFRYTCTDGSSGNEVGTNCAGGTSPQCAGAPSPSTVCNGEAIFGSDGTTVCAYGIKNCATPCSPICPSDTQGIPCGTTYYGNCGQSCGTTPPCVSGSVGYGSAPSETFEPGELES